MARVKQGHLDGMAPPSIPDLDAAAEQYAKVRNRRMKLTEEEVEAKAVLLQKMKDNKLTVYHYEDKVVLLVNKENVKVSTKGEEENGDE